MAALGGAGISACGEGHFQAAWSSRGQGFPLEIPYPFHKGGVGQSIDHCIKRLIEAVVVLVLVDRLASVAQSPSVASLASRLSSVSGIHLCDIWVRLCPFFPKKGVLKPVCV